MRSRTTGGGGLWTRPVASIAKANPERRRISLASCRRSASPSSPGISAAREALIRGTSHPREREVMPERDSGFIPDDPSGRSVRCQECQLDNATAKPSATSLPFPPNLPGSQTPCPRECALMIGIPCDQIGAQSREDTSTIL